MNSDSRIVQASARKFEAPLYQPFRVASGQHDSLENVVLTLRLKDGTIGRGEAAVAPHITGETVAGTLKNLREAAQELEGLCIEDYLGICAGWHDRLANNRCALAAVETALFDALARFLGFPLWRMWGAAPKILRADITIVIGSLEETHTKAREFHKKGFRAFKIKVGRDMELDLQRVKAVCTIAPRAQIILDANQGYSATETLRFLKLLRKEGIIPDLIEQPVAKGDLEGLKKVTRDSGVCVCADESASSLKDAVSIMSQRAAGAINVKLMKTGLIDALEISRLAQAAGVKLMIGGMMESNLSMTASAHVAAGLGCFDFIDLDTPFFIKGEVARNPYLSSDGVYDLRKVKAGIGI